MSHINCTGLSLDAVLPLAVRARGTGVALLVDEGVAVAVGHMLDGVPVITDPDDVIVWPDVVVDLEALRAERKKQNKADLWAFVDSHVDKDEREAMSGLMHKVGLMERRGVPVNEWALGVLLHTLNWCEQAMVTQEALSEQIDAASTPEAVEAVAPDYASLGEPYPVTAGMIAAALTLPPS